MSEVILIRDAAVLARGCLVCRADKWDCTVDGCHPGGAGRGSARNVEGDVIHCKICNTVYVIERGDQPR